MIQRPSTWGRHRGQYHCPLREAKPQRDEISAHNVPFPLKTIN